MTSLGESGMCDQFVELRIAKISNNIYIFIWPKCNEEDGKNLEELFQGRDRSTRVP